MTTQRAVRVSTLLFLLTAGCGDDTTGSVDGSGGAGSGSTTTSGTAGGDGGATGTSSSGSGAAGGAGGEGPGGGGAGGAVSLDCPLPPPRDGDPELPRVTVDVTRPTPGGAVHAVAAGDDLQAVLDAAQPGDVVEIAAGAVFSGNFTLPRKEGDAWIVIRSSALASLPEGRVGPDDLGSMPVLETPVAMPVLETEDGAHHFWIEGVAMRAGAGVDVNDLVVLGSGSATDPAELAHHLVLDRVIVQADDVGGKRGVQLNSAHTAVLRSHVAGWKRVGQDTQALLGWNGPGPFKIVDNFLEGAGENVMFGGADSRGAAMEPADIEICRNHFWKPLSWKDESWTVKNLLELKSGERVVVAGNVFENNWSAAQNGFGILFKTVNQDGGAPWAHTGDVTFAYNLIVDSENGANLSARGDGQPTDRKTGPMRFSHNLFLPTSRTIFQLLNDLDDLTIDHNTAFGGNAAISIDGSDPGARLAIVDNVLGHGTYGIKGSGGPTGTGSLDMFFTSHEVTGNVFILDGASAGPGQYPAGNLFAETTESVGFVDPAANDYGLAAASPFAGTATDGGDPGVDMDALRTAIAGVAE